MQLQTYRGGVKRGKPQILKASVFASLGRLETTDASKILPRGVGTLSTPGKPTSENFIFRHIKVRQVTRLQSKVKVKVTSAFASPLVTLTFRVGPQGVET